MIDYGKFRLSLERLREQYANYRQLDLALPEVTREAVPESVVHRFETLPRGGTGRPRRSQQPQAGLPAGLREPAA